MAAKSSIRDTARVLDLSLSDADYLAKLVPNMTKLSDIFESDKKKLAKSNLAAHVDEGATDADDSGSIPGGVTSTYGLLTVYSFGLNKRIEAVSELRAWVLHKTRYIFSLGPRL